MSRVLEVDAVKDYGLATILLSANAVTRPKMLMDLMNYVDGPVLGVLVDLVECFPIKFVSTYSRTYHTNQYKTNKSSKQSKTVKR